MRRAWRIGLVAGLALGALAPAPAPAALRSYVLRGDSSTDFPAEGHAVVDDPGDGSPVLEQLEFEADWSEVLEQFDATVGFFEIRYRHVNRVTLAPGAEGSGSTASAIAWGPLSGFSQTGFVECETVCVPDPCPGFAKCAQLGLVEGGTVPPAPLAAEPIDVGTWSFAGGADSLQSDPVEYVNLGGGLITFHAAWEGRQTQVSFAPSAVLLGLAVALVGGAALAGRRGARRGG